MYVPHLPFSQNPGSAPILTLLLLSMLELLTLTWKERRGTSEYRITIGNHTFVNSVLSRLCHRRRGCRLDQRGLIYRNSLNMSVEQEGERT